MTEFQKLFKQYWQLGLLAIIAIVLLTIISAMSGDPRQVGSSYSNAPNGYNAWYQMAVDRGIRIRRWQRTFPQLANLSRYQKDTTLIQIYPQLERLTISDPQQKWVEQGNTLVMLGVNAPAMETQFTADIASDRGDVRIDTTRRFRANLTTSELDKKASKQVVLSDRSGSVITQFNLDKGKIIVATTPYLAANAYQDFKPNYELLMELATKDRQQVLVDEYIHGYIKRPRKSKTNPSNGNVLPNNKTNDNLEDDCIELDPETFPNNKANDRSADGSIESNTGNSLPSNKTGDTVEDGCRDSSTGDTASKNNNDENIDAFNYLANTPLIIVFMNLVLGILVLTWQRNRRFGKIVIPKSPENDNSEAYIQALGGVLRQANSSEFVIQNIGKAEQLSWQQKLGLGRERLVEPERLITAWENQTKLPTEDLRFVLQLMSEAGRIAPDKLTLWLQKIRDIDRQLGI
jgi:hypothetical protein